MKKGFLRLIAQAGCFAFFFLLWMSPERVAAATHYPTDVTFVDHKHFESYALYQHIYETNETYNREYDGMSYDPSSGTLTMENVDGEGIVLIVCPDYYINKDENASLYMSTLTINLVGENTLSHIVTTDVALKFTGTGSLTIDPNSKYGRSVMEGEMIQGGPAITMELDDYTPAYGDVFSVGKDATVTLHVTWDEYGIKILCCDAITDPLSSISYSKVTPKLNVNKQTWDDAPPWWLIGQGEEVIFHPDKDKLGKLKMSGLKASYKYTGAAIKPAPVVKSGGKTLKMGTDYSISYKNNINTGLATLVVSGKGKYYGSQKATFIIEKGVGEITAKNRNVKYQKLKKKDQTIDLKASTNAGKLSYKIQKYPKGMKKKISVSSKGVVTLKKGAAKGKYTVKIAAKATDNATKAVKTITITVK